MSDETERLNDWSNEGAEKCNKLIREEMKNRYKIAKSAKVGSEIECPCCAKRIKKTTYNKVFCSNGRNTHGQSSCKDIFWNTTDETRRMRAQQFI